MLGCSGRYPRAEKSISRVWTEPAPALLPYTNSLGTGYFKLWQDCFLRTISGDINLITFPIRPLRSFRIVDTSELTTSTLWR